MICLSFLFAGLVASHIQVRAYDPRTKSEWNMGLGKQINPPYIINNPSTPDIPKKTNDPNDPKSGTVIENKNVNVVVNVDPKDVAKELFKLIEVRADGTQTRRSDDRKLKIDEIEKIITPMVALSRRSNRPTASDIAYALDHVTRKSLYGDRRRPTIEDEITTREVVAKMMTKLKAITEEQRANKSGDGHPQLRMLVLGEDQGNYEDNDDNDDDDNDDDSDQYINLKLKIRKSDLLRRGRTVTYVDF